MQLPFAKIAKERTRTTAKSKALFSFAKKAAEETKLTFKKSNSILGEKITIMNNGKPIGKFYYDPLTKKIAKGTKGITRNIREQAIAAVESTEAENTGWPLPQKLGEKIPEKWGVRKVFKASRLEWRPTTEEIGRITLKKKQALEKLAEKNPELFDEMLKNGKLKWATPDEINKLAEKQNQLK